MAWLLARYDRMLLIPGSSSIAHLESEVRGRKITIIR
jgi:aryl-alcohol dehydrogenase-like predicted oxidoreductase